MRTMCQSYTSSKVLYAVILGKRMDLQQKILIFIKYGFIKAGKLADNMIPRSTFFKCKSILWELCNIVLTGITAKMLSVAFISSSWLVVIITSQFVGFWP